MISIYISSMASIQIGIGVRLVQLALIQISITSMTNIQISVRPRVVAAGKTKSSDIKLQYYAFNTPLISICMPSIASI